MLAKGRDPRGQKKTWRFSETEGTNVGPDTQRLLPRADEVARLLKALSHPARLRICCKLRTGEWSVSELEHKLSLKQPNLSRELAKLRDEGLVITRRESKAIFYRLANARVERLLDALCSAMLDDPNNEAPRMTKAMSPRRSKVKSKNTHARNQRSVS